MGFTSNQLTEDAWLLGTSLIFNIRKLMKINKCIIDFWAKIPCAFRKFRWKKMHCTSRFFVFYVKHKINLTWPNMKRLHFSGFTRWSAMVKTWGVFSNNLTTHKKDTSFSSSKNSIRCTNVLLVLICCTLVPYI